jgi:ribosomal-protein-alanine N-acetyltransferase
LAGPEAFAFEELVECDLEELVQIEKECFPTPWSRALFAEELKQKGLCYWLKARPMVGVEPQVAAYMGFWKALDEAHITNLAVRPAYRRQGLGRALALHLLDLAKKLGCLRATLEVRPSNAPALKLYESLGFSSVAVRPGYYIDNGEDALIMWKNGL